MIFYVLIIYYRDINFSIALLKNYYPIYDNHFRITHFEFIHWSFKKSFFIILKLKNFYKSLDCMERVAIIFI